MNGHMRVMISTMKWLKLVHQLWGWLQGCIGLWSDEWALGACGCATLTDLTIAGHFRDEEGQDVLFIHISISPRLVLRCLLCLVVFLLLSVTNLHCPRIWVASVLSSCTYLCSIPPLFIYPFPHIKQGACWLWWHCLCWLSYCNSGMLHISVVGLFTLSDQMHCKWGSQRCQQVCDTVQGWVTGR